MRENVYEDQSLQHYLQEIAKTKTLSREEEQALAIKAKEGDQEAIRKLIESNLKFVVKIATRYQNRGLTLSELISEGNIGLIKAIEKFEPSKDVKLISYAVWWIRQRILFALAEKTNLIRVPFGQANNYVKIKNMQDRIRTETGNEATSEDLADRIDVTENNINKMKDKSYDVLSLDTLNSGNKGDEYQLLDVLSDSSTLDPKTIYYRDKTNRRIQDSIANLDERSAMVIRSYFGLDGEETKNFAEIAEELGLSRERIRQIQKQALAKILDDTREEITKDIDYLLSNHK